MTRRTTPLALFFGIALLVAGGLREAAAQVVRTAVTPDTISIGDIFHAAARVRIPPGAILAAPDTLATSGDLENAGRMRRTTRELPDGDTEITLIYPLTAWRTGELELPAVTIRLTDPNGTEEVLSAAFPNTLIMSVLPVDTAGVEPRPPKDVLGPSRLLWPWIVGAITLAAAVVAFVYYRRRTRSRGLGLTFDVARADSPKERALAALDRVRGLGLIENGEFKMFYTGTVAALRAFLEEYDTAWGTELTSSELLAACRDALPTRDAEDLARILAAADQVKFNRRVPAAPEAIEDWTTVRSWIEGFELRVPVGDPEVEP